MASAMEDEIESQKKVIEYLRSRYERDTGRQLAMPTSLGHLLGDASIQGGQAAINEEEEKKHAAEMEGVHQTDRQVRTS